MYFGVFPIIDPGYIFVGWATITNMRMFLYDNYDNVKAFTLS